MRPRLRSRAALVHRALWGRRRGPSTFSLAREIFLRGLGGIYLVGFLSLWVQIDGLAGSSGIQPLADHVERLSEIARERDLGLRLYLQFPTVFHLASSDAAIDMVCGLGALAAALALGGLVPWFALASCWALYLSLATVCVPFLNFQWDILLLETGFLALWICPLKLFLRPGSLASPPRLGLFLVHWLLFRFMFASGIVKLASGDPTWWKLTALTVHYETQPLPTTLGWYVHQFPEWIQKFSCLGRFGAKLVLPFLIFLPRNLRHLAAISFIGFMIGVALTGNYGFFNFLTVVLCMTLLDDDFFRAFHRRRYEPPEAASPPRFLRWTYRVAATAFLVLVLVLSAWHLVFNTFRVDPGSPDSFLDRAETLGLDLYRPVSGFRLVNTYGLFADMTETRPEVLIEGSDDGRTWRPYVFKWKPGDPKRAPGFVQPHMPRLDWQMWFAALRLERYLQQAPQQKRAYLSEIPWLGNLLQRLFEASEPVLDLLAEDPFDGEPPGFLRYSLQDYRFTEWRDEAATDEWWRIGRTTVIAAYENPRR